MSKKDEPRLYATKTIFIEVENIPRDKLDLWDQWKSTNKCLPLRFLSTGPEPMKGEKYRFRGDRARTKAIWTRKEGKRVLKVLEAILDDETKVSISINGVDREVTGRFLNYEMLMDLIRPNGAIYPLLTVVYKAGDKSGSLVPGRAGVVISDGMVITAVDTGSA